MKVIKPSSNFEQVSWKVIRNYDVVTVGVYAKLLTFGEGWQMNIKGLSKCLGLSIDKVRKAVTTLEEAGYIVRTPIYKDGRLRGWDYVIYGNCVDEAERSNAGFSVSQNQTTLKSDKSENGQDNNKQQQPITTLQDNNHTVMGNKASQKQKAPKVKFAELVEMTQAEYDKLVYTYGKAITDELIERLDNAKGAHGYTYKSDYRAILAWVVERHAKAKGLSELPKIDHRPDWQKAGASSEEEYNLFAHRQ